MYQLKFTLKQHTPIIHFQHHQDGATLRASEVKPKLDGFLIEKLKMLTTDGKIKDEFKSWFNSTEHKSLDYKLRIEPNEEDAIPISDKHENSPMYFANMGNDKEVYKHFKFNDQEIRCSIFSFNTTAINIKDQKWKLLDVMNEWLYRFFFINNFGTRQSKGYGSFEVVKINDVLLTVDKKQKNFNCKISLSNTDDWKTALTKLSHFYKSLRGGINVVNRPRYDNPDDTSKAAKQIGTTSSYYLKPVIFLYAKSLNHQWDKKTIKETYLNDDYEYRKLTRREKIDLNLNDEDKIEELSLKKHIAKHRNPEILTIESSVGANGCHYDFKDVFGLSSEESWQSYDKVIVKENVKGGSNDLKICKYQDNEVQDKIERFKSPLLFKLIKENNSYLIFIIINELPREYIGSKYRVYPKGGASKLVLEIPNFSFIDFFKFIKDKTKFIITEYLPNISRPNGNNIREIEKYNELNGINDALKDFFTQIQNPNNHAG